MTVGIIFHSVEGNYSIPYKLWDELEAMWDLTPLIMVDVDGQYPNRPNTYSTLAEAIDSVDGVFIALDAYADIEIKDFEEPDEDIYYIFGRNDIHGSLDNIDVQRIRIDQPKSVDGRWLWDIEAATILAYERFR